MKRAVAKPAAVKQVETKPKAKPPAIATRAQQAALKVKQASVSGVPKPPARPASIKAAPRRTGQPEGEPQGERQGLAQGNAITVAAPETEIAAEAVAMTSVTLEAREETVLLEALGDEAEALDTAEEAEMSDDLSEASAAQGLAPGRPASGLPASGRGASGRGASGRGASGLPASGALASSPGAANAGLGPRPAVRPSAMQPAPRPHMGPPPRPPAPAETFIEGDHVVYPTHGVGKVERIVTETIAGYQLELIHITFEENRMTLRVPVEKARSAGLRKLASRQLFEAALATLKGRARIKRTMWSRRAQEYEAKINSGDPLAIAEVVRDLHRNAGQPDQSFSERQIYEAAMDRLAAELAALDETDKTTAVDKLAIFLRTATH